MLHLPPDDPLAALNILREAVRLGPSREGGEEEGGDGRKEPGEKR